MREETKSWRSEPPSHLQLHLSERIRLAREHMDRYGQHDVLWPNQRFSLTIRELLAAAERGV